MPALRLPLLGALAVSALLAGCAALGPSAVNVRVSRGDGPGEHVPPGPAIDTAGATPEPRGDGRDVGAAFPGANDEVRRVCRASSRPRGWIATAYVEAPGECPVRDGPDGAYNAAVLVRHERWHRGAVLEVCADQPVPADWVNDGEGSAEATRRCPGAGKGGAGRSMRIRRTTVGDRR